MNKRSMIYLVLGVIFTAISVWQINNSQAGLEVTNLHQGNPPVTIITPSGAEPASRPTVLIAHGFAGSSVLMRGYALTLAHAGYTTVSWDFQGHGVNGNPFLATSQMSDLLHETEIALDKAVSTGIVDTHRIAILGHSMGSGVALAYGIAHPDTSATIAISPTGESVTSTLPRNLLLMAGSLEPQFVNNAQQLLARAGGPSGDLRGGTARKLVVIPKVEHISILFSPQSHAAARTWLDDTFGAQPGASTYTDRRVLWFGLGILGSIILANACVNLISNPNQAEINVKSLWLRITAILGGGIVATGILWLVGFGGARLSRLLGLLVGGYILIWFGVAGVVGLLVLRPRFLRPTLKSVIVGLVAFIGLWLGVGLLGNFVWLPWLLIPYRLELWIPGSIILFPWFMLVGEASKQAKLPGQVGWWLFQTFAIITSLYLALRFSPELGFIFIILPLVPVMTGIHTLTISSKHGSWSYAIPGALFTAWLLLAVFPLQ